ncbi:MAG: carboxymuconolactone decarboxylase family protein [Woeseiaceae bacterium]|nr:carboxymuconolactone decarboxylase family protein [Woeseiaceae bacterium]
MSATPLQRMRPEDMPAELKQVWQTLNDLTGEPTFVEVFAQAPELLDFVMRQFYGNIFFGGRVDERYKQLARLRLSQIHGCRTCNKQNVPGALEAGFSEAQVAAMDVPTSELFTDAEIAVLEFAEQMALTNDDGRMDETLYERLSTHFDDAEICELGTVMGVIGGMAKLSFVMDLVEREDYCPFAA